MKYIYITGFLVMTLLGGFIWLGISASTTDKKAAEDRADLPRAEAVGKIVLGGRTSTIYEFEHPTRDSVICTFISRIRQGGLSCWDVAR